MLLNKNHFLAFIVALLSFQVAFGQTRSILSPNQEKTDKQIDSRTDNLKKQADELIEAFDKNNVDRFVELTHPKIIQIVGGKEKLILMMKTVIDQNPRVFESFFISIGNPTALVETDRQLFGVVPQKFEGITLAKHKLVQNGCIVGVSDDNGKNWKFVSGEKFSEVFPPTKYKVEIIPQKTFIDGVEQ